jgi:4-diphosphocytidyl-2C-methyl-D-erythritol kinase
MSRDVRVVARSKLTLSLRVVGRRSDGFHELEALVVSLRDPHDVIGMRIQAPFGVRVRLSGRAVVGVPVDETNLAARAARLLLEVAAEGDDPGPWAASGLDISLHKTIPAGAGLGGGSADAAGTLVGGARLLGLELGTARLAALGAVLGSDVPFCVAGGAAWMRGRGEILEPLTLPAWATPQAAPGLSQLSPSPAGPGLGPFGTVAAPAPPGPSSGTSWPPASEAAGVAVVVVVPQFQLSTAAVYRAWDELKGPSSDRAVPLPAALAGLGLPGDLVNDLEPAAEHIEPRLRPFREALEAAVGAPALLAGSGSAYVVPVASPAQAAILANQVSVELRATAFATGLSARGVEAQRALE